eukprot:569574-Prymnesium_polylepis.1
MARGQRLVSKCGCATMAPTSTDVRGVYARCLHPISPAIHSLLPRVFVRTFATFAMPSPRFATTVNGAVPSRCTAVHSPRLLGYYHSTTAAHSCDCGLPSNLLSDNRTSSS